MNRKKRGYKCTAPEGACHPLQHQEEKKNCDGMQEDVAKMIASGAKAEELRVEHQGNRREWMPVTDQNARKSGGQTVQSKPTIDSGFFVDVEVVIVVDE